MLAHKLALRVPRGTSPGQTVGFEFEVRGRRRPRNVCAGEGVEDDLIDGVSAKPVRGHALPLCNPMPPFPHRVLSSPGRTVLVMSEVGPLKSESPI